MKNYTELNDSLQGRNKDSRKVANNTYLQRRGGDIALKLHSTDIITWKSDNSIIVDTGGWQTPTTKDRLNNYLPAGCRLYQKDYIWFWDDGTPFTDGDVIKRGKIFSSSEPDTVKEKQKLKKRIKGYAKDFAKALPVAEPSGGDCWYCYFTINRDGNDTDIASTDHLTEHIREKYYVPSLLYKAMKQFGCTDFVMAMAFGQMDGGGMMDVARRQAESAVKRYLNRRLGLAS